MYIITSLDELFFHSVEDISSLNCFVVSGLEVGTVRNIFFESNKSRFSYQTTSLESFSKASSFVSDWLSVKVNQVIESVDNGEFCYGDYLITTEGVMVDSKLFKWNSTSIIFDGVIDKIIDNNSGMTYEINNTIDFHGYLISQFIKPLKEDIVKESIYKWLGMDLKKETIHRKELEERIRYEIAINSLLQHSFLNEIARLNESFLDTAQYSPKNFVEPEFSDFSEEFSFKKNVHSLVTYYPARYGFDKNSNAIIKVKNKDLAQCERFAKDIYEFIQDNKLSEYEVVVVPSSKRGFPDNGMSVISSYLSEYGIAIAHTLLERVEAISPAHISNNRNIVIHRKTMAVNGNNLQGRKLLLLDDIKSTGNTIVCAQEKLCERGASSIVMLVLGDTYLEKNYITNCLEGKAS